MITIISGRCCATTITIRISSMSYICRIFHHTTNSTTNRYIIYNIITMTTIHCRIHRRIRH
ncbi:unnamed protein product [Schistosoma curassoni]|uniref:Secreted protein n=1 Tax=Schistosoma curassoni TaxID=6186 RepID=A0A183KEH3_9TREM|nr:unnamed protein product [Schistosoma curassoni]